jgi:methyl-accepting chemotaxis protein
MFLSLASSFRGSRARVSSKPAGGMRLRLTHKIMSIAVIGLVGLVTAGVIYQFGNWSQDSARKVTNDTSVISDTVNRLALEMFRARQNEKNFQLHHDETFSKRFAASSTVIDLDFDQLKTSLNEGHFGDLSDMIGKVRAGYSEYAKNFQALVAADIKLGLKENLGLSGSLRAAVHDIELKLKDIGDPQLNVWMLMMRRHEKDFMLRRDAKYIDDLKNASAEFSKALESADIADELKSSIRPLRAKYQQDFLAWAAGVQEVAAYDATMSKAFQSIEPLVTEVLQGVDTVAKDAVAHQGDMRETAKTQMFTAMGLIAGAIAVLSFLIGRAVSKPLQQLCSGMQELAEGNFAVVLPGLSRRDEIGDMARAVELFKDKAQQKAATDAEARRSQDQIALQQRNTDMRKLADEFEGAIGDIIETVSSASTELEASAGALTSTAESTRELSSVVASASEEASANVQSVASASEEMASSVNEISRQVQESARIAGEAVEQAQKADNRVNALSQSATRIGDVVELINTIAGQTNLLALNATIEAARAGEAGRGFAVVASEVKALAEQTAKATGEISLQIADIQSATQESVAAIEEISGTIGRISEISSSIASAIEEQGAATQEISRNVQQAAQGTQQVTSNITNVQRGATETQSASSQVLSSAQSLSQESNRLKKEVGKFLDTVRAA